VVRYLQESGAGLLVGEPYVEVEAMKMIMPIKATESGKITQSLFKVVSFLRETFCIPRAEGSLKVKKIVNFEGSLDIPSVLENFPRTALTNVLWI
jgi:acetyl-CoA carboxylase/biotin carboxylase 1